MDLLGFLLDRSMVHVKRWGFSPAKIQDEDDSQHHAERDRPIGEAAKGKTHKWRSTVTDEADEEALASL